MKIRTKAGIAGLALFMCAATHGATQHLPRLGTSVRNGTILSMSSTGMVVVRMHKGNPEPIEFVLNAETVRKGAMAVGDAVTVHYRIEKNRNIATSIQKRKS